MVWDAFIAIYLFLAGLGAGAFVLGALTNWAKKPTARMKRIAFIIAPVAVAVGTLVLVVDAHAGFNNPMRFFLLISNLGSVMSWGVIILSVFLAVSIVDLVLLLVKKRTPKALDIAGMVLAVCVAAYTGVLLGDAGLLHAAETVLHAGLLTCLVLRSHALLEILVEHLLLHEHQNAVRDPVHAEGGGQGKADPEGHDGHHPHHHAARARGGVVGVRG